MSICKSISNIWKKKGIFTAAKMPANNDISDDEVNDADDEVNDADAEQYIRENQINIEFMKNYYNKKKEQKTGEPPIPYDVLKILVEKNITEPTMGGTRRLFRNNKPTIKKRTRTSKKSRKGRKSRTSKKERKSRTK